MTKPQVKAGAHPGEDTDEARSSDASERGVLEDLRWLGLLSLMANQPPAQPAANAVVAEKKA